MANNDSIKKTGYVETVKILDVEKRYRSGPKHYVFVIQVKWVNPLNVFIIYRRYAQFFDLQCQLLDLFANAPNPSNQSKQKRQIPFLPGKIILGRSQVRQIALERKEALNEYCQALIALPEHISRSQPILHFFQPNESDVQKPLESMSFQKKLLSAKSLPISKPIELPSYRCINDFTASDKLEMSVKQNVMVKVLQKHDNGWWFVQNGDQRGFVPGAFLQPREEPTESVNELDKLEPSNNEVFVVNKKYDGKNSDELTLEQGSFVTVTEKSLTGWWTIKFNEKSGLFPSIYLSSCQGRHTPELARSSNTISRGFERSNDSSLQHSNDSDWDSDGEEILAELSVQPTAEVWYAHSKFTDDQGDCLSFERGDQIEIHRKYSNGWWSGRALNDENPILTWIPANYLQQNPIVEEDASKTIPSDDYEHLYASIDPPKKESNSDDQINANFDEEPLGSSEIHSLSNEISAVLPPPPPPPPVFIQDPVESVFVPPPPPTPPVFIQDPVESVFVPPPPPTPPVLIEEPIEPVFLPPPSSPSPPSVDKPPVEPIVKNPTPPSPPAKVVVNKPIIPKPIGKPSENDDRQPKSVKDLVKIFNQN